MMTMIAMIIVGHEQGSYYSFFNVESITKKNKDYTETLAS